MIHCGDADFVKFAFDAILYFGFAYFMGLCEHVPALPVLAPLACRALRVPGAPLGRGLEVR